MMALALSDEVMREHTIMITIKSRRHYRRHMFTDRAISTTLLIPPADLDSGPVEEGPSVQPICGKPINEQTGLSKGGLKK